MRRRPARRSASCRLALLLLTAAFTLLHGGVREAFGDVDCREHHAQTSSQENGRHGGHADEDGTPEPCNCLSACHGVVPLHVEPAGTLTIVAEADVPAHAAAAPWRPATRVPHFLPPATAPPQLSL